MQLEVFDDIRVRRSLVDQVAYVLGNRYRRGRVLIGDSSRCELLKEIGVIIGGRVGVCRRCRGHHGGDAHQHQQTFHEFESSKVAARAQPAPEHLGRPTTQVQTVLTTTWLPRRFSPRYSGVSPASSWCSASATVNGKASSSSGRCSAATPSHSSTRPATAITAAPMRNDQTTWPRSPDSIS